MKHWVKKEKSYKLLEGGIGDYNILTKSSYVTILKKENVM